MSDIKAAKREFKRKIRVHDKEKKKLHRMCFWTWPWGHCWKTRWPQRGHECIICGKTRGT